MKTLFRSLLVALSVFGAGTAQAAPASLKLSVPAAYLPQIPVLIRVEALTAAGEPDRDLWDATVALSANNGVTLSTNVVTLRNGLGSALVTCAGGGDFTLTAALDSLATSRTLLTVTNLTPTTVSGTLPGTATTWSGVVRITGNVTVPVGHTLTIASNTLVMLNGVASGTVGTQIIVNGTLNSEGTEAHPITITCADAALRWGQIRHDNAQPSTYRWTSITRAGRATGEGHTGQAPVLRPNNSTVTFENCNVTDHADVNGTPGKIAYGINASMTFRHCLFSRARMGPEVQGTAVLLTNTWVIDMRGPDDADGIYLYDQQVGQEIKLSGCVFAGGDDDGIDTLGAIVAIDNTIVRNWNSVIEDAKAISVFSGRVDLRRCLITDSTVGVSAKTGAGTPVTVTINHCTIVNNLTNVLAQFKANAPGPVVDYRITNSVLWGGDAVQSDFAATNFTIRYSTLSEVWPGTGNLTASPQFISEAARNFRLRAASPAINSGDPASPTDADGSRADMGFAPFVSTTNTLIALGSVWKYLDNGSDQGTGWTARTFNDSTWTNGPAELGYGDSPADEATVVSFGPDTNNKFITTYFRRAFVLTDPASYTNLALRLRRDDGGVVYLNGTEIFRSVNMPAGTITFTNLATATGENDIDVATVNLGLPALVEGTNVIAVEMHQQAATSSDLSFDLELIGATGLTGGGANTPPTVTLTSPANNATFTAPATVSITATASDANGSVTKVEFFQNGNLIGEDTSSPYAFDWSGVAAGIYSLTAVATDNQNATTTSSPISITVNGGGGPTTNTLVALGASWAYLDNGTDQGTNWSQRTFDSSSWVNGVAPLGYCGGGCAYTIATTVSFGPNPAAKFPTTYFRRSFNVANPAAVTELILTLLRDDGAVVYVNGVEVHRVNMPAGVITNATLAIIASNYSYEQTTLPPVALAALVTGPNVLAIEVHQGTAGSSDLALDARLDAVTAGGGNALPIVSLTAPANGLLVGAPANVTLTASASDADGTVTNVAFYANITKLADDPAAPYNFAWNGAAAGIYALTAVATDNSGASSTSAVVNLAVSANTAAPVVFAKSPAPGNVTALTQITVTFSKDVQGVNPTDLLINGVAASSVSGSGSNYVFTFAQPAYGTVSITWVASPGITDLFTPPVAFNPVGAGATWQYQLLDAAPPVLSSVEPAPGSGVAALTSITVEFSEAVTGVNAADLLINGSPASSATGSGVGPYIFNFTQPALGNVAVTWAGATGIQDSTGNPFAGGGWSYTLDTNAAGVVISEIMYHPSSENVLEEYIELFNKGASPANLNGWRLSKGVQYAFTNAIIPPGGYLVVAADTNTFAVKYPGITNVVGNWIGILANSSEDIDLDNQFGNRVDSVRYADEGDWAVRQRSNIELGNRGWVWFKEHDGLGKSLELLNPVLSNNDGQNWAASRTTNGTPGRANSVQTNNLAPLILGATHSPLVPRPTDPVTITARIVDETPSGLAVTLFWRVDAATPPAFTNIVMRDDGTLGDIAAGDGLFSALIPAQANNSVIEFYIRSADPLGAARTWPAPAIASADDGSGPIGQVVNALYQVDGAAYSGSQPLYKMIMTEAERAQLAAIPSQSNVQGPNSQMNGTFLSFDGAGVSAHYLVGIRNRGHGSRTANPPNYHVAFRSDDPWKKVTGLNLNTRFTHLQHLGSVLARRSGVDGADSIAVQVRVNNANRAVSGSPMFGSYAANEEISGDWAADHFPDDGNGNVYRVVRDINPPDFTYRGEDKSGYTNTYFKMSNESEDNWSDLIAMKRIVGIGNPTSFTTENVRSVVNVEQWMRHMAFMNIVNNRESGLNTGFNDDYFMYAGAIDPRFILSYWDLDTILGSGDSPGSTSEGIYSATANNGSGLAFDRFLRHPDFEPIYFETFRTLLNTVFEPANFDATVDYHLGPYVPAATINSIKSWMSARRTFLLGAIPPAGVTNGPVATIIGIPRSPTPLTGATLTVGGTDVVAYRRSINGGAYGAETPVATAITLSGLANGTNRIAVIGLHANGTWQAESNATVRSWIVNTSWPTVRLNEILAQNDSAVNHSGTFPDLIELFNEGTATVDLSGLRLTDNAASPSKFTFPNGTTLAAGARLVVYANNPDATPGLHTGFTLDAEGEGVFLIDRASSSGTVLDSVTFGLQLGDRSIGRINGGDWVLNQPTFGGANVAQSLGSTTTLKINEWLASGAVPNPDDFIELYNPDALPVPLGGLHLTDQPIGAPKRSPIAPLSFIAGGGYRVFLADGKSSPANHANFGLAVEQGEIGLMSADGSVIDCVIYAPQTPGYSSGRCPDGAFTQKTLSIPTPGSPNACPPAPPAPVTVGLIALTNIWSYEESNTDLGTAWSATAYDDSGWPSGAALLGLNTDNSQPDLIRTPLTVASGKITFYFRTHFNLPANINLSELQVTHAIDDGAVFYLNGVEAGRFNMPAGAITFTTQAASSHEASALETITISPASLVPGDNVLAVEVHQQGLNSSDIVFGLRLDAVIVTNTPGLAGVVINEVLANNANIEEADGSKPDWVEIYNPSSSAVDLADMSLTDDTLVPRRWVFPAGSIVPAQGFRKVRLDGGALASTTNTGFGLKASGGAVYLINRPVDGGAPASFVTYGLQAADFSLGRIPDGSTNWVLNLPTFGSANLSASLGDPLQLKVNEWMASPASGNDWIEIYNPNAQPVELSGLWLSDTLATPRKYQIPARSFIGSGPEGFLRFWCANGTDADFTGFSLNATSEDAVISTAAGTVISGVHFVSQIPGISEGRLPDGTGTIVRFITTATPGNANFLPLTNVFINELIAHTDPPLEDAVEIFNATGDDLNIGGWYLSDSQDNLLKFRIAPETIVPAGGFRVLYEYQFNSDNPTTPFSFSSAKGDQVYLSQSTAPGTVTGYRAFAEFDASENGVSFGRYRTSVGVDFTTLSARTFGVDNPATTNQFRTGTGRTNAYPKVGPVVINEIMYNQVGTNDALEFVELHNILGTPQSLFDPANPANTWRMRKGIDFDFPTNITIPAGGFVLLVNFNPAIDTGALATFRAAYPGLNTNTPLFGPYGGKLDNGGETVELQKPDAPQTIPGPDFGLVPRIVVDRIIYSDIAPWPLSPDGLGDALKRLAVASYGNDPANWSGGAPTPGAANFAASGTNTPPVLAAIGNRTATEGVLLSFNATATDADIPVQSLTFSLDAGAPGGASISPSGAFTWAPSEAQGPGSYPITIRVTDSGSPLLSDSETITITVNETNNAPVLNPIGNKSGAEGTLITFTATATDTDEPVQTLAFTLNAGAPAGAVITTAGVFTWTPGELDGPGVYPVTVRVTDNGSPARSTTEIIQITVAEANVAPVLAAIGNKSVSEGSLLTFTATATDFDQPAQALTFSLDAGAPSGTAITTAGVFTWTPTEAQGPFTNSVTIRVADNGSPALSDFETIQIIVNEVNVAPVLAVIGNKTVAENILLTFTATATDADQPTNTLTFSLDAGAPSGASITTGGVFTWTPTPAQGPSTNSVIIRVTDNGSPALNDFEAIQIIVTEPNAAPVLAAIGNKAVNEGTLLTFTATATDANTPAQTLTYSLDAGAPSGAAITTAGVFTWTPTEAQGPFTNSVTIRVTDNGTPALNDSETFNIVVSEVNTAPVLASIGNKSASATNLLTFTATATDADLPAQTLTFTLDAGAPAGASITAGGIFTWTPTPAQAGASYPVTIRVTDNRTPALDDAETIMITVAAAPIQAALVPFTSRWRYNTNAANLLTAWREVGYDDSSWPEANGAFYNETSPATVIPVPTNTFLPLTGVAGRRITNYYFRTTFNLPADVAGITLAARMALDDGAVIYINGVEAQRVNMPAGPITVTTFSAGSWEANALFTTNISAASLAPGVNTLAVEVHQQNATSSDVVFDLQLEAVIPPQAPIAITQQPTNLTVNAGQSASFSVGVSGAYPLFQWFKDGLPIPGARSAALSIPGATPADAGFYSVHVSNLVSRVTSSQAGLTVNSPVLPPEITSVSRVGNTVTIVWSSAIGRTYRVDYKDDLTAPFWNPLGAPVTATGTSTTATDTTAVGQRFYRVVLTE